MVLHPEVNLTVKLESFSGNHEKDRNALRQLVLDEFIIEQAGTGKGNLTSKYRYNVELLSSGRSIYLERPAVLNKGFDFVIHVENEIFMNGKSNPKHADILGDLRTKKNADINIFNKLVDGIGRVYDCEDPDDFLYEYKDVVFKEGFSIELIMKVIKWLFIEQDIRFWNWSGRSMFMEYIQNI